MAEVEVGSPDWWLSRFIRKLGDRQPNYKLLNDYAVGNHPVPNGDTRYVRALQDLQNKAKTNYVALALKACTQRMRLREFKFQGEVDKDAGRFWKANNMEVQSSIAIADAAKFADTYALVSPPDPKTGIPVITIEDPRQCVVERDPVHPYRSLAGMKFYDDPMVGKIVAVLFLPNGVLVYHGDLAADNLDYDRLATRVMESGSAAAGFELVQTFFNPLDEVPLIYGQWQPETGLAECEDGPFAIQDRINHTLLDRLVISKSQAYRQRVVTGVKGSQGLNGKPPFDPGADAVWVSENPDTKVFDLDQVDIKQLLEAIRDDIGDFAALTQTPVTYLTNRMVNVSGDALTAAQHSHVAKVRRRMEAMGWFFEHVIKLCFLYLNDPRANEVDSEVLWADPETRTIAELADMAAKFAAAGIPMTLTMEKLGFSSDEIDRAQAEMERAKAEERAQEIAVKKAAPPFQQQPFNK